MRRVSTQRVGLPAVLTAALLTGALLLGPGAVQQAAAQGNLHIDTKNLQMGMQGTQGQAGTPISAMPMLDLRQDPSRRQVVFDILKKHGFDPHEAIRRLAALRRRS